MSIKRIGRMLKEEEQRFIDYAEIETRTTEMGFPISVRTLRFYVDEGILPPPNRIGKKPVYDEDWILNVLLSLHIMKTRMNRSLKDIRVILANLKEDPARLADKLSALYQEVVKGSDMPGAQRDWAVEAVFGALTGKLGTPLQASEVSLTRVLEAVEDGGTWTSEGGRSTWVPPKLASVFPPQESSPLAIRVSPKAGEAAASFVPQARILEDITPRPVLKAREAAPARPAPQPVEAPRRPRVARRVEGEVEVIEDEPIDVTAPVGPVPEGAVSLVEARNREEFYLARFETEVEGLSEVLDPLQEKLLPVNARTCTTLKRDHAASIIQRMKSRHIYDRALLDAIPMERATEFHISRRGFFGRGELRVVITGQSLSPIEEFLEKRYAVTKLGPEAISRAISELVVQPEKSYFVGLFSTTGWSAEAIASIPNERNLSCHLVEKDPERGWLVHGIDGERGGALVRLFDPETDVEKVERVKRVLKASPKLTLKGGHVVVQNIVEDLDVAPGLVRQAMEELVVEDPELSFTTAANLEILKRARF